MSFEVARYELWAVNSAAATRMLPALPEVAVTSRLTLRVVNTQMEAVKVVFRSTICDFLSLEKLLTYFSLHEESVTQKYCYKSGI